jgi:hypothetical protein
MNREARIAAATAKAATEAAEKVQRASALAGAREQMNGALRQQLANGAPKVTTDTSREGRLRYALDKRDGITGGGPAPTGQGLDQGIRDSGGTPPDTRTPGEMFNDQIRAKVAARKSE